MSLGRIFLQLGGPGCRVESALLLDQPVDQLAHGKAKPSAERGFPSWHPESMHAWRLFRLHVVCVRCVCVCRLLHRSVEVVALLARAAARGHGHAGGRCGGTASSQRQQQQPQQPQRPQEAEGASRGWTMGNMCGGGPVPEPDLAAEEDYMKPLGPQTESNPVVFFDIAMKGQTIGRIEMELKANITPKTAENFRQLCTGESSTSAGGVYKGSEFHRIIPNVRETGPPPRSLSLV
jgi:hypothetical protein